MNYSDMKCVVSRLDTFLIVDDGDNAGDSGAGFAVNAGTARLEGQGNESEKNAKRAREKERARP